MADSIATLARARNAIPDIARTGLTLRIEDGLGVGKFQIVAQQPDESFDRILGHAPPPPRTQIEANGLTLAWLAPGEWLIIGAEADVAHMVERLNAQGGDEILALDVSHARFGMVLSGRDARLSLAAHCPLDLADDVFPVGMVARSLLGDTGMFLARLPDSGDGPQLRIVVDQTMAGYAVQMLAGFKSVGAHV